MIQNITATGITNDSYTIVNIDLLIKNKPFNEFIVPGFHNFKQDEEVKFFIPSNSENEFKALMKETPILPYGVIFHGMDSKMIGHYLPSRINNNGGGTILSNSTNPSTMTELSHMCFDKHQPNNIYYYVLSPLSFYETIYSKEILRKVLDKDLENINMLDPGVEVHLFVNNNFLTVNNKHKKFESTWMDSMQQMWMDSMQQKKFIIHRSNDSMKSAIQYVFGVKTPSHDMNLNEYIKFDSTSYVEFAYSSSNEVQTTSRSDGRVSIQTSSLNDDNIKLIVLIKGVVSKLTFLDESIDINPANASELKECVKYFETIFNNFSLKSTIEYNYLNKEDISKNEKDKIILENATMIVQTLFCQPKIITDDDDDHHMLKKLYSFSQKELQREISKLSYNNIYFNDDDHLLNPLINSTYNITPILGRQASVGNYF